jgi:Tfp pilus tip-associated adhesin PilY1
VLAKLRYKQSGAMKFDDVLVIGGGYDNKVDDEVLASTGAPIPGAKGNDVFIVNAKTGDLIWSASMAGNSLQHSVPGDIRVLDLDRNGSIDRLYFGDTGGNIWRADLNVDDVDADASLHDVTNDARVSKFASLGVGGGANARKFFYEPDVSLFKHNGTNTIVVSVGSGYRSHPLNETINDRFYVLYDENVFGIPTTAPAALVEGDLIESNTLAGRDFLPAHKGWYKKLVNGQGEKVLASPITFNNKVIFTTFANTATTTTTGVGACTTLTNNQTRAYVLDLMTASATVDLDDDGSVDSSDDSIIISHGDILDSPQLVFNELSDCTSEGCDQHVDIRVGKNLVPIVDKNTKNGNANLGDFLPRVFWVSE